MSPHHLTIPPARPSLTEIAQKARIILDGLLAHCNVSSTKGTCLYASLMLAAMLTRGGYPTRIRGGDGYADGGLYTSSSQHGHYWCEATADNADFIVDLTADQFGFEVVVIKRANATDWPRYIPGCQATVDLHVSLNLEG
ncbi:MULTISPECIES: hypothetical protein [Providencia]|uniref:Uncharacterized protein n=6 Tax=Enterobacterales TaxID=91347 RepID=A0A899NNN5_PROST|nr:MULTISPECIES: hypothetical protein [Providencia]URQ57453.1 Hypothetical protein [Providencia alcalifaciens]MCB4856411.1 hypothetical protein [Providencia rettgeri]MCG9517036.1 hypothetical protein [Providencia rettgeri]MCG9529331.1 hypothetical protein [Providencia rettgeri]MCG9533565.1 hypothetical protein [Providencia huaxiensis]